MDRKGGELHFISPENETYLWSSFCQKFGISNVQPWRPRQDTVGEDTKAFQRTIESTKLLENFEGYGLLQGKVLEHIFQVD